MGNEQSSQLTEDEKQAAIREGEERGQRLVEALRVNGRRAREESSVEPQQRDEWREGDEVTAARIAAEETPRDADGSIDAAASAAEEQGGAEQNGVKRSEVEHEQIQRVHVADETTAVMDTSVVAEQQDQLQSESSPTTTDPDAFSSQSPSTPDATPDATRDNPLAAWQPRKERVPQHATSSMSPVSRAASSDLAAAPMANVAHPAARTNPVKTSLLPAKRPSGDASLGRLSSLPAIPKKQRTSLSHSVSPASPASNGDSDTRPPAWLSKYTKGKASKLDADSSSLTRSLKNEINKVKNNPAALRQSALLVRDKIHKLFFILVDEQAVCNNGLLTNASGLPQIFDPKYAGGIDWPYDIRADAKELYTKWADRIFETDLLRGIKAGKPKNANKEGRDEGGSSIMSGKQTSSKYVGNGKLINGQWWPTLLCAVRDGAHGETVAGISGDSEQGAYSCFISGGGEYKYPDIDEGDVVYYCGTDNKKDISAKPTRGTQMMLNAQMNQHPVRFIRSSKAADESQFAPQCGFRYDGLYDVVDFEVLDKTIARHRFKLVRRTGQDPIRGGDGPEARPTREEVEAYNKDKRLRGFKA